MIFVIVYQIVLKSITDIDYEMEDIHNEVFGHHKI